MPCICRFCRKNPLRKSNVNRPWLMLLFVSIITIAGLVKSHSFVNLLGCVLFFIVGILISRVICEVTIIFFRMNEHLQAMRDNQRS